MLRLKTLLSRTPANRFARKRRHPVIAKVTKSVLAMDDGGMFMLMHGKSADIQHMREHKSKGPHLQVAKIYMDEDGKITNPKTFVWCDCQDFTYRCEVALALRGSSAVVNSNGALPKHTNPNAVPMLCSHGLAFLEKCLVAAKAPKPSTVDKLPKTIRSDRELIESLRRPQAQHPNLKRMFKDYFAQASIQARSY